MITENVNDSIVALYTYMQVPANKISDILGICRKTTSEILKDNNIDVSKNNTSIKCGYEKSIRKYRFNEHFFDIIDTEEKAYILGFFMADGTNIENQRLVEMRLQKEDKYILDKINSILESNRPLRHFDPPKRFPNRKEQYGIMFRSLHFSKTLKNIGMCRNKSYLLKFPTCIPDELMNHFVRGYFDGDGSICNTKYSSKYRFSIVGTEDFIDATRGILHEKCGVSYAMLHTRFKERDTNTRYITYSGRVQAIKFGSWLYKDATIYLTRKLEKFPPEVKILTGLTNQ